MKACRKCGELKPLEAFHRRNTQGVKDGRGSYCTICVKARSAAYYKKNRERIIEKTAAYGQANPAVGRRASAKWRTQHPEVIEANREKARLNTRAWIAANPERKKAQDAKHRRENPEKHRLYRTRRRLHTDYKVDPVLDEWLAIVNNDPCPYCGGACAEDEHIEPRRRLTPEHWNTWSNQVRTCQRCNRRKSDKTLLIFLSTR